MIKNDVQLGNEVMIYHPDLVNLYGCKIGSGTKIGAFVELWWAVTVKFLATLLFAMELKSKMVLLLGMESCSPMIFIREQPTRKGSYKLKLTGK